MKSDQIYFALAILAILSLSVIGVVQAHRSEPSVDDGPDNYMDAMHELMVGDLNPQVQDTEQNDLVSYCTGD